MNIGITNNYFQLYIYKYIVYFKCNLNYLILMDYLHFDKFHLIIHMVILHFFQNLPIQNYNSQVMNFNKLPMYIVYLQFNINLYIINTTLLIHFHIVNYHIINFDYSNNKHFHNLHCQNVY